jgi:epoxyqueuosine reductase
LLSLSVEEFRQRFRGSPIRRAKRRGFLRNVAVASATSAVSKLFPALIHALDDDEPLVRGHVAWALGQIGSSLAVGALQRRLQLETDLAVRG